MALRETWAEVVEAVRKEARLSTNTSRGTDSLENIKQLVKRHYYTLAEEFDWQHLNVLRDDNAARKVMQDGLRFYDFPASINVQKIERAWVRHSGVWLPLTYGITHRDYSISDPEDSEEADPVQKWRFHGGTQFEVWPMPATNGTADGDGEVAFEGQKIVTQLTADADRLDMDDILVALFAAAEILAGNGQKDAAAVKAAAAQKRLQVVRGNMASKSRVVMGIGVIGGEVAMPRHPTYIRG